MARAVRFDRYGGVDELYLAEVDVPTPPPGEVVVQVRAVGINPGEAAIRRGLFGRDPSSLPSGQGSDLAGVIDAVGDGVTAFAVGDEVLGWSFRRSSQADYVTVPADQLVTKPAELSWPVAGSLYMVAATATAAVRAVQPRPGDVVAVSAAAGGVGVGVVQLLTLAGATVIGIGSETHHDWLRAHGVVPVSYGDGLEQRLRTAAPAGIDAFIDLFGPDYVRLAVDLGVPRDRIETIISFDAAQEFGTHSAGSADGTSTEVLARAAGYVAGGQLEIPIAATYPLTDVRRAYIELERRHSLGRVVLLP